MGVLKQAKLVINSNRPRFDKFNELLENHAKINDKALLTVSENQIRAKAKEITCAIPEADYQTLKKASGRFYWLLGGAAGALVFDVLAGIFTMNKGSKYLENREFEHLIKNNKVMMAIIVAFTAIVTATYAIQILSSKYVDAFFTAKNARKIAEGGEIKES